MREQPIFFRGTKRGMLDAFRTKPIGISAHFCLGGSHYKHLNMNKLLVTPGTTSAELRSRVSVLSVLGRDSIGISPDLELASTQESH